MQLLAHATTEIHGNGLGRPEKAPSAGHVQEGLVEPDGLHQRGDVDQDPVQAPAQLGVAPVASREEDRVGAQLACPHRRHGRVHPIGPCFVGA